MSSPVFVYDTGMRVALDRGDRPGGLLHEVLTEGGHPPIVPLPVLARPGVPASGRR